VTVPEFRPSLMTELALTAGFASFSVVVVPSLQLELAASSGCRRHFVG
jgi:hypothetical protein